MSLLARVAAVASAAALVIVMPGCANATSAAQLDRTAIPSFPLTPDPQQPCPPTRPAAPGPTGLAGARAKLVPFQATGALVCQYRSPMTTNPNGLQSSHALTGNAARSLGNEISSAVKTAPPGTVNCPMAQGKMADVFLWDQSAAIQVQVDVDGCEYASNGTLTKAYVSDSDLTGTLNRLAPGNNTPEPAPPSPSP